jgi:dTDP-4-dehydrorhamnose reductase
LKVIVTGAGGMVGQAVRLECERLGDDVVAYDRESLDITDAQLVLTTFERDQPSAVINCAAWTDVDGCERDPARAQAANSLGPENLALASRRVEAALVSISTDYVFDGEREGFYTQRDDPNPQSVYALAKLAGERRAQLSYARTVIVRSGFIFGPGGRNFLSTIGQPLRRGERIKAIGDAWGTPTYAKHLAVRLRELAQRDLPGVYHAVNSGEGATYEEFARVLVEALGLPQSLVEGFSASDLKRPAARPRNSRLRCLLSEAIGLEPLPSWQDAVRDFAHSL